MAPEDSLNFRPLEKADLELLLAWRSNPLIYEHFRGQDGPLTWVEHVEWFETRPPSRRDYVIEYDGRRVGSVFLDADGYVGVYVGEVGLWGKDIGRRAIRWLCDELEAHLPVFAEVHEENDASQRVFENCGFSLDDRDGDWIRYRYES